MAVALCMPKLGMTMEEGTVVSWEAQPGDAVEKGAVLFVIENEKTESEIESIASGVLRHIFVPAGDTVPCSALLAAITETADEPFDADAFAAEHAPAATEPEEASTRARRLGRGRFARSHERRQASGRTPVAPAARKLAAELGLDATSIPGTGPGGRVTRRDVEAFAAARASLTEVAPGVALDVPRDGSGTPVLFLPGFGTDVSSFAPQTAALAESFEVFGVNPRGVGGSDAPAEPVYAVAQAAADAAAIADAPAHVVGASLGAAVAIELALAHPEKVRSLTLITPFLRASPRLLAVLDAWSRIAAAAPPAVLAHALLPWLFGEAFLADDAARERTARGLAGTVARVPAATLERAAAGLRAWSGTREDDVKQIAVPTLVIAGGSDLLTPDPEAVAARIPGARLERFEAAGHAVAIEAAEAMTEVLRAHLAAANG